MDHSTTTDPDLEAARAAMPAGAPDALSELALGRDVSAEEERGALSFLLGKTRRLQYTLPVQYDTEEGMKTLRVRIQQCDDRKLNELDAAARDGDGPFAKLDTTQFNASVCAEGMVYVEDETGRRVMCDSEEWIGGAPNPVIAMEVRFKFEPGLLEGIAEEIRRVSGYAPNRVGSAQRVLVNAVGKP
jgi:hypothetical protein